MCTKFFVCLFVRLFVCLYGEGKIKGFRGICALRVPFSSLLCFQMRDRIDNAGKDNEVFSRLHVLSAQYCIGTARVPEVGTITDYTSHETSQAYGQRSSCFIHSSKDNFQSYLPQHDFRRY